MEHKILHLADIHFDTPFLCRSESIRLRLKKELQTAFRRAIDFAVQEKVMAVVIAGDLVDAHRLSLDTETFLLEQLHRLDAAQIPCVYVAGRSDPSEALSQTRDIAWPASFIYVRERSPKIIELQDIDGSAVVRIVGVGCESRSEDGNPALRFPAVQDGIPYVGVLHAPVGDAFDDGEPRWCDVEDLRQAGYAYWALGHDHTCRPVDDAVRAWYAGSLIGTNAGETGPRGGLVVTVHQDGSVETTFKAFSTARWYRMQFDDLNRVHSAEDLVRAAARLFERDTEDADLLTLRLLHLTLTGMCPMVDELHAEAQRVTVEEKLARRLNLDDVEVHLQDLTPLVDVDAYRGTPTLLGEVLALLDDAAEDAGLLDELAPDPLAAQVAPEDRPAYLARIARALDREAIVRLTHEDSHAN